MLYLFIGGYFDGLRLGLTQPAPSYYRMPIPNDNLVTRTIPDSMATYQVVTYRREVLFARGNDGLPQPFPIYVEYGMTMAGAIKRLIEGYGRRMENGGWAASRRVLLWKTA